MVASSRFLIESVAVVTDDDIAFAAIIVIVRGDGWTAAVDAVKTHKAVAIRCTLRSRVVFIIITVLVEVMVV